MASLPVVKAALADNRLEVRGSVGVVSSVMRHHAYFISVTTNAVRNMHFVVFCPLVIIPSTHDELLECSVSTELGEFKSSLIQ